MNNEQLTHALNAIRGGDKAAFEALYKDMRTPVYTVLFRITWDKPTAEDLLQEVFIKLYCSPPKLSIKNPRAYIFRMARNLAIDNARKSTKHTSLDDAENAAHQPLDDIPLRTDIENALRALPMLDCQIVTLHITGGLKFREISDMTELPLGTVLWRYQKAIGKLQKTIGGAL